MANITYYDYNAAANGDPRANCTTSLETVAPIGGGGSQKVIASGAGDVDCYFGSQFSPFQGAVTPSAQVTARVMAKTANTSRTLTIIVDWMNSSGGYISTSVGSAVALTANVATLVSYSPTPPALSAFARIYGRYSTASGAGESYLFDEFALNTGVDTSFPSFAVAPLIGRTTNLRVRGGVRDLNRSTLIVPVT